MANISTLAGSANPPITVEFKDDCGLPRPATGVQALVYDVYGTLVTTVTFGTFTPAAAADTYGTTITERILDGTVVYELVNLPTTDPSVFPDSKVTVQWTGLDTSGTFPVQWEFYEFTGVFSSPGETSILSWTPIPGAKRYRVKYQVSGSSDEITVGYTTLPFLIFDPITEVNDTVLVPGTDGSTWQMYVPSSTGALATSKLSDSSTDPLYVNGSDGTSVWSLQVDGTTGALSPTLTTQTAAVEDVILPGTSGVFWQLTVVSTSAVQTDQVTDNTVSNLGCNISFCVEGLDDCINSDGTFNTIGSFDNSQLTLEYTNLDLCIVTGSLFDVASSAKTEHRANFFIDHCDTPQIIQNTMLHRNVERTSRIDREGRFAAPLVQGALMTLEIPTAGAYKFVVPAQSQADISSLDLLDYELYRGE